MLWCICLVIICDWRRMYHNFVNLVVPTFFCTNANRVGHSCKHMNECNVSAIVYCFITVCIVFIVSWHVWYMDQVSPCLSRLGVITMSFITLFLINVASTGSEDIKNEIILSVQIQFLFSSYIKWEKKLMFHLAKLFFENCRGNLFVNYGCVVC